MSKNLPVLLKKGEWKKGAKTFKSNGKEYLTMTPDELEHFRKFRLVLDDPLIPRTTPIKHEEPVVEEYNPEPAGKLEELGNEEPPEVGGKVDTRIAPLRARYMRYNYKDLDSFAEAIGEPADYIWEIGKHWPAEKAAKQATKAE